MIAINEQLCSCPYRSHSPSWLPNARQAHSRGSSADVCSDLEEQIRSNKAGAIFNVISYRLGTRCAAVPLQRPNNEKGAWPPFFVVRSQIARIEIGLELLERSRVLIWFTFSVDIALGPGVNPRTLHRLRFGHQMGTTPQQARWRLR